MRTRCLRRARDLARVLGRTRVARFLAPTRQVCRTRVPARDLVLTRDRGRVRRRGRTRGVASNRYRFPLPTATIEAKVMWSSRQVRVEIANMKWQVLVFMFCMLV